MKSRTANLWTLCLMIALLMTAAGCRTMTVYVGSQHNDSGGREGMVLAFQEDVGNNNVVATDGQMGKTVNATPEISPLRNVVDNALQAPVTGQGAATSSGSQERTETSPPEPEASVSEPEPASPSPEDSAAAESAEGSGESKTPRPPEASVSPEPDD